MEVNLDNFEDFLKDVSDNRTDLTNQLLQNIKNELPELEKLLDRISGHWCYEDLVYRYYHHSFKVYYIQDETKAIVELLIKLCPHEYGLSSYFVEIYEDGIGKKFKKEHNREWKKICAPMVEAFFHAKYFLEMIIKYGKKYDDAPELLDSGWASVLSLYRLR